MTDLKDLIREYGQEITSELSNEDHSIKPRLIASMEDHLPNPIVWDFLLSVAGDTKELDLARMESLTVIGLADGLTPTQIDKTAKILLKVLESKNEDEDVCNSVVTAAKNFLDSDLLYEKILQILVGDQYESALRWNAIGSLERHGKRKSTIDAMSQLIEDDEYGFAAKRILAAWQN